MTPKGSKLSDEHKFKIRLAKLGHSVSDETRRKISLRHKGKQLSNEHRAKISASLIGRSAYWNIGRVPVNKGKSHSSETRAKISLARKGQPGVNKGKIFSADYRAKLRAAHIGQVAWNKGQRGLVVSPKKGKPNLAWIGEQNPRWKGGITSENRLLRESIAYTQWRTAVFQRDHFTCKSCGQVGGKLQADHIHLWSKHPELRFDVNNGQTLCCLCHRAKTNIDLKEHWMNQYSKPDVNVTVTYR